MDKTEILKKPLITEKVATLPEKVKGEKERYAFLVDKRANKLQIAGAVKEMYGVKVDSVNTMNYRGKIKTRYTKTRVISGATKSYKKAIVTLAKDEYIDFYGDI